MFVFLRIVCHHIDHRSSQMVDAVHYFLRHMSSDIGHRVSWSLDKDKRKFVFRLNENRKGFVVPYRLRFLIKLFQLQLFENCSGGTDFGRLNRSKSACVGGRGFVRFLFPVDGRGGNGKAEVGRCRRSASCEQAVHGKNSWVSFKWAKDCPLLTRKIWGGSSKTRRGWLFESFFFSANARSVAMI